MKVISIQHIILALIVLIPIFSFAQKNPNDHISKGNSLYDEGKFGEAEVSYKDGQTEGADPFISGFNLGDALFKQERFEEAATAFQALPNLTEDKEQKAAAYHNLGNSFIKAEKFQEGVDAYKQSLRNNPKDLETKYNLAYAKRMLQQQQEQEQKQDQNKDKEEQQKNQDQKQNQEKQEKEDEEQKDNKQQQQQEKQQKQEDQQKELEENKISKEDAERMLDALNQDEKEIRDRLEKQKVKKGTKGKIEKDW
jgi:tetratricopeptide (TPR) repeat protein